MQAFTDARDAGTPDEIWLTEHPPVYTLGLAGRREHLRRDAGIPVIKVDRGGQVTYHGPGQVVAYLLLDLRRARLGVRDMVRAIEAAVVQFLDSQGISAYGRPDAPGVYVRRGDVESKIAALGLKVRNGCTYHGLALNVAMTWYPSGHRPVRLSRARGDAAGDFGVDLDVEAAGAILAPILARRLARTRP